MSDMSARPTEVEFDPSATLAALISSQRVAICSGLSSRVLVNSESGQQVQFDHLKRRKFIKLIGGTALLAPFAIRAQQPAPASGPLEQCFVRDLPLQYRFISRGPSC